MQIKYNINLHVETVSKMYQLHIMNALHFAHFLIYQECYLLNRIKP